jgi:hypothetical protein
MQGRWGGQGRGEGVNTWRNQERDGLCVTNASLTHSLTLSQTRIQARGPGGRPNCFVDCSKNTVSIATLCQGGHGRPGRWDGSAPALSLSHTHTQWTILSCIHSIPSVPKYKIHTDVYRHILECRCTHFALYVVPSGTSEKTYI